MITDAGYLEKLRLWAEAKDKLEEVKALEGKLRKELFDQAFPEANEGTNTEELPGGWKIKGIFKVNYTVDEAALPEVLKQLTAHEVVVDNLVSYKPSLKVGEFKKLPENLQILMGTALTIKPGAPTLELVPPKGAK